MNMATAARDALLAEFDHEIATTKKLLERLPGDSVDSVEAGGLAWRPHPKSMTLGGLATHIANISTWSGAILNEGFFDLSAAPPPLEALASRSEILKLFFESSAAARKAMDKSDAEYAAMWTLKRGGQEVFSMPRVAVFRSFVLSHLIHHRGQLSVYLRLNGIAVPAIYGPSADEGQ
jgi:uncharacterized damage-inducible protein DinB